MGLFPLRMILKWKKKCLHNKSREVLRSQPFSIGDRLIRFLLWNSFCMCTFLHGSCVCVFNVHLCLVVYYTQPPRRCYFSHRQVISVLAVIWWPCDLLSTRTWKMWRCAISKTNCWGTWNARSLKLLTVLWEDCTTQRDTWKEKEALTHSASWAPSQHPALAAGPVSESSGGGHPSPSWDDRGPRLHLTEQATEPGKRVHTYWFGF